jgi:hypothetical protein
MKKTFSFVLIFLIVNTKCFSQDLLGGLALGAGLDVFANKIHEAIERATGAGLILEVNAGGEIAQGIDQMKQAYEKELNLTWSQLGPEEQQALTSLNSTLQSFVNKTFQKITDIEDQAQAIIHVLPLSKTLPILSKSNPQFIVTRPDNDTFTLTLKGDFYDMGRKSYEAYAVLGNSKYKNTTNSLTQITFEIPYSVLKTAPNSLSANYLTIQIPYRKSAALFFHSKDIAEFKIALGTLPNTPGQLVITTTQMVADVDVQHKEIGERNGDGSYEFRQESGDDDIKCGGEHADLAIHKCYPDAGYRVRPNTVSPKVLWSQGKQGKDQDWWFEKNCSTAAEACLCSSTEHHRAGTSGKIHFLIVFDEEKDIQRPVNADNNFNLTWNQSTTFDVPLNASWKAKYTSFDGSILEFSDPLLNNPYLNITVTPSANGQKLTISTLQ